MRDADRRRVARILFALIAVTVSSAVGYAVTRLDETTPDVPALASAAVSATPGVLDNSCADGRAVKFSLPSAWTSWPLGGSVFPVAQVSPDGVTVVAVASPLPGGVVLLKAFTNTCAPDLAFGNEGTERLRVQVPGSERLGISIDAAAAGLSGSIILAGAGGLTADGGSSLLVGVIEADGQVDRQFGKDGWAVLPWQGDATALLQEPSGEIVVGNTDGGGCCIQESVAAVSPNGAVLKWFGDHGRERVALDSGVEPEIVQVSEENNGDILVLNSGGHMGAWASTVSALSPRGQTISTFTRNLDDGWQKRVPVNFLGDLVPKMNGFVMIGAGQSTVIDNVPAPSATGLFLGITSNGEFATSPRDGATRFQQQMLEQVWTFPTQSGGYLMLGLTPGVQITSVNGRFHIQIVSFTSGGSLNRRYGQGGRASIELPSAWDAGFSPVVTGSTTSIAVIAPTTDGSGVELFEVKL
jgi:hypothetical protein